MIIYDINILEDKTYFYYEVTFISNGNVFKEKLTKDDVKSLISSLERLLDL